VIDDPDLNLAMLEAVGPLAAAAREFGPLPAADSDEFIAAPLVVRQAVLCTVGISRVHLGDPVRHLRCPEVASADASTSPPLPPMKRGGALPPVRSSVLLCELEPVPTVVALHTVAAGVRDLPRDPRGVEPD
jgi:hypothetical protein